MHRYTILLTLLAATHLTHAQPVQTTLTCLSDGQCVTSDGEDAVCGKLSPTTDTKLPVVTGEFNEYKIRIDLSAPLEEDVGKPTTFPEIDTCPPEPTINTSECESEAPPPADPLPTTLFASVPNPRNPNLGGVGCETPAFRKLCVKCCVQTSVLQGFDRLAFDSPMHSDQPVENRCESTERRQGTFLFARRNCFQDRPLGFYRAPRPRFFTRCHNLARRICSPALARCRDNSRR